MLIRKIFSACLFIVPIQGIGQLYFPNETFYISEIHRLRMQDSVKANFYESHLSSRPVMDYHVRNADSVTASYGKHYYWITQKIFKENFIILQGKDFWCSIDPILDLEIGAELAGDTLSRMYWNTRGMRVQAKITKHVSFTTSIYESQAKVPYYVSEMISRHGEFVPNPSGTVYAQFNGVVPGYARTKAFKINGYDFGMAEGQFSIYANKHFNVHAGNGSHFIGNGYRSMLLSDYAINYPFIKFQTHAMKGRLQYSVMHTLFQNLIRMKDYNTIEPIYERKSGTFYFLDFAVSKNLQVGFFHGSVWNRLDTSGTRPMDYAMFNPIIYSNLAMKKMENAEYQSVIGLNAALQLGPAEIYGQFAVGASNAVAGQFGIFVQDLPLKGLDIRIETNIAERNAYLADNPRMNYSHSNLPLAHPLVGGFRELVAQVSWNKKGWFVTNTFIYSARDKNDSAAIGTNIFSAPVYSNPANMYQNHVMLNRLEFGYRMNKTYNLQIFGGHCWRNETKANPDWISNYVYFGIRTKLRNKTLDF